MAVPEKPMASHGNLTENMLIHLKGASPWLRFIGILGFIISGTVALWGLFSFTMVFRNVSFWGNFFGFESINEASGAMGLVLRVIMIVFTIGSASFIFFPSLFAYRFGENIQTYLRTGADRDMETALKYNKSFWKFFGIVCIIYLAFIPMVIIISIIAGMLAIFS